MNLREHLLKSSSDVKKAIKVPFQVRKDKKQLESWLIDKESDIADLELKIQDIKSSDNFNPDKILDIEDDLVIARRRLQQGQDLLKEMFESDVTSNG